jgi:predicted transcriptional regulator
MSALSISQFMRKRLPTGNVENTLEAISQMILEQNVGLILIKEDDRIVGVITKNDVLRAIKDGKDLAAVTARGVMSTELVTCSIDDSLEKILALFKKVDRSRLLVMKGEEVVGVIYRKVADRFAVLSRYYGIARTIATPRRRMGGR